MLIIHSSKSELQAELEFLRQRVDTSSSSRRISALPATITNNPFPPQNSSTPQSQVSSLATSDGASQGVLGPAMPSPMSRPPGPPVLGMNPFSAGHGATYSSDTQSQSLQDLVVDARDIDECFSL